MFHNSLEDTTEQTVLTGQSVHLVIVLALNYIQYTLHMGCRGICSSPPLYLILHQTLVKILHLAKYNINPSTMSIACVKTTFLMRMGEEKVWDESVGCLQM